MQLTKEQILIKRIAARLGNKYVGDDCALLPGNRLVSCDTLVDGTHFISDKICLNDLGWKAMAVNVSDIAAMAGCPKYAVVALTLPPGFSARRIDQLYDGLIACARAYRLNIVGGDITRGSVLTISITIIGETHANGCLLRSGAKAGDRVIVTGTFGDSMAGLRIIQTQSPSALRLKYRQNKMLSLGQDAQDCLAKHTRPLPRLHQSWDLIEHTGPRAALMDASDGLADALVQIATASDVGITIDLEKIPISNETRELAEKFSEDPYDWALYGGEDFELVGCLPEAVWQSWQADKGANASAFTEIGEVTGSKSVAFTLGKEPGPEINLARTFQHIRDNL
jgi:thiamine-monophosphate kinase